MSPQRPSASLRRGLLGRELCAEGCGPLGVHDGGARRMLRRLSFTMVGWCSKRFGLTRGNLNRCSGTVPDLLVGQGGDPLLGPLTPQATHGWMEAAFCVFRFQWRLETRQLQQGSNGDGGNWIGLVCGVGGNWIGLALTFIRDHGHACGSRRSELTDYLGENPGGILGTAQANPCCWLTPTGPQLASCQAPCTILWDAVSLLMDVSLSKASVLIEKEERSLRLSMREHRRAGCHAMLWFEPLHFDCRTGGTGAWGCTNRCRNLMTHPQSQMQQHRESAHRKHTTKVQSWNATTLQ